MRRRLVIQCGRNAFIVFPDLDASGRVFQRACDEERALAAGIKQVCFDRGSAKYHGRVAALADAARKSGLSF